MALKRSGEAFHSSWCGTGSRRASVAKPGFASTNVRVSAAGISVSPSECRARVDTRRRPGQDQSSSSKSIRSARPQSRVKGQVSSAKGTLRAMALGRPAFRAARTSVSRRCVAGEMSTIPAIRSRWRDRSESSSEIMPPIDQPNSTIRRAPCATA